MIFGRPEIKGITAWFNSNPLTLKGLKGKAVLVDFWTYTCVNCIRTLPHLKAWHAKYAKAGLIIIGVNSPEFNFEKDPANVEKAVRKFGLKYPIAVDSNMRTWSSFSNSYWPAKYLFDKEGKLVYKHFGEGQYEETEVEIQKVLGLRKPIKASPHRDFEPRTTAETYCGYLRGPGTGSGQSCTRNGCDHYHDPGFGKRFLNALYPDGDWHQSPEFFELKSETGSFAFKYFAKELNLVIEPLEPGVGKIFVDGKPSSSGDDVKSGKVELDSKRMFNLIRSKGSESHDFKIEFSSPVKLYAFTFG